MPDLPDVTHSLSMIYNKKGELEKSLLYALVSAKDTRTDSDKWQQCAQISLEIQNYDIAKYCYNRAWKLLNKDTEFLEILDIKL